MDKITDKLFFDKIEEIREAYFIEYRPPAYLSRYAILNLVFFKKTDIFNIVEAMENEVKHWITKYRIPILAFAFDETESLYDLSKYRPGNHLIGYFDQNKNEICLFWSPLKDDQIPDDALNTDYLKLIYSGIPYTTDQKRQYENNKRYKKIRFGWFIFGFWLVVVPVIVAYINVIIPYSLQVLIFFYCVYKSYRKLLELLGKSKKSNKEKEREQKELKMQHYYYYCEQNPEGFLRFKQDTIERSVKEDIQKEAAELKLKAGLKKT